VLNQNKSNFELSQNNPGNTFQSMTQIQFDEENMKGDNAQLNQKNREVSKNLQKDLRSSHFKFGNNNGVSGSASHNAHPKFEINTKELEESTRLAK